MCISIEKASPADAVAIIEFLKQAGGETDNLSFGAEGLPIAAEAEAAYLARLENSGDDIMLVAKSHGKIIGNASLNRLPRRMGHRGEISVAVLRAHWNAGVGSRLMRKLIDFARENAFEIIDLQVRSDNLPAIHLYEKFGFKRICTYPAFFKIDGQDVDFDFMCLRLESL